MEFNERTELAIELAKCAGERALEIQKGDMRIKLKGVNDIVTVADMESERIITEGIAEKFGEDGIIAEEGSYKESESGYIWVTDPLDGTFNFSRGMAYWAVSVGYMKDGGCEGGACYVPRLDELFVCERGKGAFLNGERIKVSDRGLKGSIGDIGFGSKIGVNSVFENVNRRLMEDGLHIRKFGSAVMGLCYVACGRLEVACTLGGNIWDISPASLMVEEAGGRFSRVDGGRPDYMQVTNHFVVGTNGGVHERVLGLIQ